VNDIVVPAAHDVWGMRRLVCVPVAQEKVCEAFVRC